MSPRVYFAHLWLDFPLLLAPPLFDSRVDLRRPRFASRIIQSMRVPNSKFLLSGTSQIILVLRLFCLAKIFGAQLFRALLLHPADVKSQVVRRSVAVPSILVESLSRNRFQLGRTILPI